MPPQTLRRHFPILDQRVNGHPLAYLDSAATTQKPQEVIDALVAFYTSDNANVHRGIHQLAERATLAYEQARTSVAEAIGCADRESILFTRGTTESINLVASSYLRSRLGPGDAVLTTLMEHHSNFVPWQQACRSAGAELRVVPVTEDGTLDMEQFHALLTPNVRLVAVTHVSNVLGVMNPIAEIVSAAHAYDIPVLLDAAQSLGHLELSVTDLDLDFVAASAHKAYGPTGIGVLYVKPMLLQELSPYQFGGDMIASVTVEESIWNQPPYKFEAGTPNIAGAVGFGAALRFLKSIGFDRLRHHEGELLEQLLNGLGSVPGVKILGPRDVQRRSGLVSFTMSGIHPHDVATLADEQGVAIRAGFHCAEPLHRSLGLNGSVRVSLGMYSTAEDVEQCLAAVQHAQSVLQG